MAIREFGVIDPIGVNAETGHDFDGNGRLLALRSMMAQNATLPPKGVLRDKSDGMWLVPVVAGITLSAVDEERASLALNYTQTRGGYEENALTVILSDLASQGALSGTGYDPEDVDRLLLNLNRLTGARGRRERYGDPTAEYPEEELQAHEDLGLLLPEEDPVTADWPVYTVRMPPEALDEFKLGVMLLQEARGHAYFYQALLESVRIARERLRVVEEPEHGTNGAGQS